MASQGRIQMLDHRTASDHEPHVGRVECSPARHQSKSQFCIYKWEVDGKCQPRSKKHPTSLAAHANFCAELVTHQIAFQDLNLFIRRKSPRGPKFNMDHTSAENRLAGPC